MFSRVYAANAGWPIGLSEWLQQAQLDVTALLAQVDVPMPWEAAEKTPEAVPAVQAEADEIMRTHSAMRELKEA